MRVGGGGENLLQNQDQNRQEISFAYTCESSPFYAIKPNSAFYLYYDWIGLNSATYLSTDEGTSALKEIFNIKPMDQSQQQQQQQQH